MAVPEEIRARLSRWCADSVPAGERDEHQIGYTTQGREITVHERRPPAYPELGAEWSTTPVAQLRMDDPEPGRWTLYRAAGSAWERVADGDDPLALLQSVSR